MYDCPNCGGNLNFDIKTQQLLCDFCHSTLDPYELEAAGAGMEVEETAVPAQDASADQSGASEEDQGGAPEESGGSSKGPGSTSKRRDLLQMTVFTCPACGAQIASTNLSATGFCTYCGASAVFKKRVRGELRPQKIIPFQKTKDDCKAAYGKAIGSNFYAVKELKDPAFLDQFVGVYMPYWSYDISAGPDIRVDGIKTHKKGNYLYTDHYDLKCSVDAGFRQISYDASSAFDDRIHEGIAPFEEEGIKPFTPGYMAGFYADIADVPSEIYQDDAEAAVGKEIYDKLEDQFPAYTISTPGSMAVLERNLKLKTETSRAMFPVWFLTYRKDDRVAYAVVNGQTGKVYADVPVDTAKFLMVSLGLAIPLFILANLFLTITAPWMLTLAGIFAAFTALIFDQEMSVIKRHEQKLEDAGYIAVTKPQSSEAKALTKDGIKKAKFEDETAANVLTVIMCSIIVFLAAFDYIFMAGDFLALHFNGKHGIVAAFVLIITLVFSFKAAGTAREIMKKRNPAAGAEPKQEKAEKRAEPQSAAKAESTEKPESAAKKKAAKAAKTEKTEEKKIPMRKCAPEALICILTVLFVTILHFVNPVEDFYFYGGAVIAYLGITATLVGLIRRYNLLATRPVPQFHNRTKQKPGGDGSTGTKSVGTGRKKSSTEETAPETAPEKTTDSAAKDPVQTAPSPVTGALAVVLLAGSLFGAALCAGPAFAQVGKGNANASPDIRYTNPNTGYMVVISDEENLLTDTDEMLLVNDMMPVTEFGHAGFASGRSHGTIARWYAEERYQSYFGTESGTMFVIDLDDREIRIHSDGAVYKAITNDKANTITDNCYRYASSGLYYLCAEKAFNQILAVLNGERIAQPMKYINNALLALILAILLNYCFLRRRANRLKPEKMAALEVDGSAAVLAGTAMETFVRQTKKYISSSSSGGGGGRSGGGGHFGGGGHHGGGGGHRF